MANSDFIRIVVTNSNNIEEPRFINKNHIRQIFEHNNKIIIELTEYESVEVMNMTLNVFLDRFIQS